MLTSREKNTKFDLQSLQDGVTAMNDAVNTIKSCGWIEEDLHESPSKFNKFLGDTAVFLQSTATGAIKCCDPIISVATDPSHQSKLETFKKFSKATGQEEERFILKEGAKSSTIELGMFCQDLKRKMTKILKGLEGITHANIDVKVHSKLVCKILNYLVRNVFGSDTTSRLGRIEEALRQNETWGVIKSALSPKNVRDEISRFTLCSLEATIVSTEIERNLSHALQQYIEQPNEEGEESEIESRIHFNPARKDETFRIIDNVLDLGLSVRKKYLEKISIPNSVSAIKEGCFSECKNLKSVVFQKGSRLTGISEKAFYNCVALKKIVLPESVKKIELSAFHGCKELELLELEKCVNLQGIGSAAFSGCTSLERIEIPRSVKKIGGWAFSGCKQLSAVILKKDSELEVIEKYAFRDCVNLKQVTLPNKNIKIVQEAFPDGCAINFKDE